MSKNKANGNDFDTNDLIRNQEVHSKDISSLADRILCIENKFGNNERIGFAAVFNSSFTPGILKYFRKSNPILAEYIL